MLLNEFVFLLRDRLIVEEHTIHILQCTMYILCRMYNVINTIKTIITINTINTIDTINTIYSVNLVLCTTDDVKLPVSDLK